MTLEEQIADMNSRPVYIEAEWNGLDEDHTYYLNLVQRDEPYCLGTVIAEKFMTGITDGVKKELSQTAEQFSVERAAKSYVQLMDDETGKEVACCSVNWLQNHEKGSRKKLLERREQMKIKDQKKFNKEPANWDDLVVKEKLEKA